MVEMSFCKSCDITLINGLLASEYGLAHMFDTTGELFFRCGESVWGNLWTPKNGYTSLRDPGRWACCSAGMARQEHYLPSLFPVEGKSQIEQVKHQLGPRS